MKSLSYLKKGLLFTLTIMLILTGCGVDGQEATGKTEAEEDYIENEYRKSVFDSSLTEGKLAVYYLQGLERYTYYNKNANSGESILIVSPEGKTMLIDTNVTPNTAYVVYALQQLGIEKIDYFVNTHVDLDHLSGFALLARNFEIGQVLTGPYKELYYTQTMNTYDFYRTVESYDIPWNFVCEGDAFTLGEDVEIKIYNPPSAEQVDYSTWDVDENEWSIVMRMTYGDSSYFFGGDIGNDLLNYKRETITYLIDTYGDELRTDIVKMNHHGGDNSKSMPQEFIDAMDAKLYVGCFHTVSYETAYVRCMTSGAEVLHTALDGTVVVSTAGDGTYDVQVEQDRYSDAYGEPEAENGHMRIK